MQARLAEHSELTTHSGLQPFGPSMLGGKHTQLAFPLTLRHWLLGPHGEGIHGFGSGVAVIKAFKYFK